jgi:alpha-mannosidase
VRFDEGDVLGPEGWDEAARFGAECSQGLIAAAAADGELEAARPRLRVEPAGVLAAAFKPSDDGKAWIVRLFGASGRGERARVAFDDPQPRALYLSDLSERPIKPVAAGEVDVPAWGMVTLRAERAK